MPRLLLDMKPLWKFVILLLIAAVSACDRTKDQIPGVWLATDDPQNASRKVEFSKDGRFAGGGYEGRWSVPKRGQLRVEFGEPGSRQPMVGTISGSEMSLTWIDETARFVRDGSAEAARLLDKATSPKR